MLRVAMSAKGRRDVLPPAAAGAQRLLLAVLRGTQAFEDLLAGRADRELLGVTARHPDLAAERHHRLPRHGAVHDLVLADIVREAFVVPRLAELLLDLLALDHRCRGRGARGLPLGCERVVRVVEPVERSPRVAHAPSLTKP